MVRRAGEQGPESKLTMPAMDKIQVYQMDATVPFKGFNNGLLWGKMRAIRENLVENLVRNTETDFP